MLCPRCDGEGELVKARIIKTGTTLYLCDECEATWFSIEDVGQTPFVDYGTYMEENGLRPLWDELNVEER